MFSHAALFFGVALLYALVGFGGGSSYTALLFLFGLPYALIPTISLLCNLIVVSGGSWHFCRQGHYVPRLFWPFALSSVPMAFVGGLLPIGKELFLLLLGLSLFCAGLRLLWVETAAQGRETALPPVPLALLIGAVLGLLSGLVGIGGGIFLAPLLLNLGWGRPKQVAATASLFILVNSLAGLLGQWLKQGNFADILPYWPLLLAVLLGGQFGSRLG
ncbi:MAG: sulfoacetate transporter, partial [Candidatus Melainabacteria bacterium HGW-Melainabacteria-1]